MGKSKTLDVNSPEMIKVDMRQLSVRSVPRLAGERDAFALGYKSDDGVVWYAEHAYRAVSPYGAIRFSSATAAWQHLTALTGRRRPDNKINPFVIEREPGLVIARHMPDPELNPDV